MNKYTLLSIFCFLFFSDFTTAQSFPCTNPPGPVVVTATPQVAPSRTVDFIQTGASNCAISFYLLEDGHFSIQNNPTHEFHANNTPYAPEYYSLKAYDNTPPQKKSTVPGIITTGQGPGTGSSTANIFMNGSPIRLGKSWRAARGYDMIYIVSLEHPGGATTGGTVTLNLDSDLTLVQPIDNGSNNNGWGAVNITSPRTIEWAFTGLQPGSQNIRHFYVQVNIPANVKKKKITSTVAVDFDNINQAYADIPLTSRLRQYPNDPNGIEASGCIEGNQPFNQTIEYIVYFQNNGSGYANTVQVQVNPDLNFSLPETVQVLESSAPLSQVELGTDGSIWFTFPNINLPGSNQHYPNTYTYDQTTGYVRFKLCTNQYLPMGTDILSDATIYFDQATPVYAGMSSHLIDDKCTFGEPFFCDVTQEAGLRSLIPTAPPTGEHGKEFTIFPNPVQNQLTVSYEVAEMTGANVLIHLYSAAGRLEDVIIPSGYHEKGVYSLQYNTSNLPAGIYMLQIQNGQNIQTKRIVKTK